ncbi:MAG TPA: TIGR03905 family protein [Clostridiales bacterium]|nr:TIGR03905 family protein [Clostridiales bacterium]
MEYVYIPEGVCSQKMIFNIENNIIKSLKIIGGCAGNTVGLSKMLEGQNIDEVIKRLKGIPCGYKGTSCPDQIARALEEYKKEV